VTDFVELAGGQSANDRLYDARARLKRMCICSYVCAVCSFSVGERGWGGFSWSMKALVAWRGARGFFDRRKDKGNVYVFSISNAGGRVYGCRCVYTRAHTHTAQMVYSIVSPGVGMRHLETRKNPD